MPFAALRLTFTSLLPREGLLAGDRQHRDVSWLGMLLPLQNGWWEALGMALGSQEQMLQGSGAAIC